MGSATSLLLEESMKATDTCRVFEQQNLSCGPTATLLWSSFASLVVLNIASIFSNMIFVQSLLN